MKIIKAKKGSEKTLALLNNEVQVIHIKIDPNIFKKDCLDDCEQLFSKLLVKKNHTVLIAFEKKLPIGYIHYFIREKPENALQYSQISLHINHICILPAYRKLGIGNEFINRVKKEAKRLRIKTVDLNVWNKNRTAKSFFKSMGFEPTDVNMKLEV